MNDSFVFYKSYYDAISLLKPEQQVLMYNAICSYSLYDDVPELPATEMAIFTVIKPTLDSNLKRREDGKKGGRPKKSSEEKTSGFKKEKPVVLEKDENEKPNENENENENEDENEDENVNGEIKPDKPSLPSPSNPNVETVVELYHEICKSYPKIKSISEARRKAVRARLRTYDLGEFRAVFGKAEESEFLKGKNDRDWSATFDWIIKDSNFAKILDGNYDNKSHSRSDSRDQQNSIDKYNCVINQFDNFHKAGVK